jgi:hypothetical protein
VDVVLDFAQWDKIYGEILTAEEPLLAALLQQMETELH